MKCARCQQDSPAQANFCQKCGAPLKGIDATAKRYTDLKDEVDGLTRSLTEALEQQTATGDPTSPRYWEQVELYAAKRWRNVQFTEDEIGAAPGLVTRLQGGRTP